MPDFSNIPIKIKTNITVSQAMPYLEVIAGMDGLRLWKDQDMKLAWNKFKVMLMICEQYCNEAGDKQDLKYWVKDDFHKALTIFKCSVTQN
jgi:hypothetical protein